MFALAQRKSSAKSSWCRSSSAAAAKGRNSLGCEDELSWRPLSATESLDSVTLLCASRLIYWNVSTFLVVSECFLGSQMQLDAHMTSTMATLPEIPAVVCVTVSASRRVFIRALRRLLLLEAPFLMFTSCTVLLIFWNQVVNCWCLSCGLFLCI